MFHRVLPLLSAAAPATAAAAATTTPTTSASSAQPLPPQPIQDDAVDTRAVSWATAFPYNFRERRDDAQSPMKSVSKWKWRDCCNIVDLIHDPTMFGERNDTLWTPRERAFLELAITLHRPTIEEPRFHTTWADAQSAVNRTLMVYLREKYGADVMSEVDLDYMTNQLKFSEERDYLREEDCQHMLRLCKRWNHGTVAALERVAAAIGDAGNTDKTIRSKRIDELAWAWLGLSGLQLADGSCQYATNVRKTFQFAGQDTVAAISDCLLVQAPKTHKSFIVIRDKGDSVDWNAGRIPQLFGEALCALITQRQTMKRAEDEESKRQRVGGASASSSIGNAAVPVGSTSLMPHGGLEPPAVVEEEPMSVYAMRMNNGYCASFFRLDATPSQLDAVASTNGALPPELGKMTLWSDSKDPTTKKVIHQSERKFIPLYVEDQDDTFAPYYGWSLGDKAERVEAQWRMATIRKYLLSP